MDDPPAAIEPHPDPSGNKKWETFMLKFYFNGSPNPTKVALFLEESGLPFEPGPPIAKPGTRRIYSNPGYEALAARPVGNLPR